MSFSLLYFIPGIGNNEEIPQSYTKSENCTFEARVHVDCNDSTIFSSSWTIKTGTYFNESINSNIIGENELKLRIQQRNLDYGIYKICCKVVMEIDNRFQREHCGYIEIEPTPLVANIDGGDKITIPSDKQVSKQISEHKGWGVQGLPKYK